MPVRAARGILVAGLLVWAFALPASGEMVRWVDERGTVHFAASPDDVPLRYRGQIGASTTDEGPGRGVQIVGSPQSEGEGNRERSRGGGDSDPDGSSPWQLPARSLSSGSQLLPFGIEQLLAILGIQFLASMLVLAACTAMIGEKVEHLLLKVLGSVFAQRFLMFAAWLLLSASVVANLTPDGLTVPEAAKLSLKVVGAEICIMGLILRFTICRQFARALMLSVLFCAIDAVGQGAVLFGALALYA